MWSIHETGATPVHQQVDTTGDVPPTREVEESVNLRAYVEHV